MLAPGDLCDDDLALHHSISPRKRIEAVLSAQHMSSQQAADALTAQRVGSHGRHPHIVVASVDPQGATRSDEPELAEVRECW